MWTRTVSLFSLSIHTKTCTTYLDFIKFKFDYNYTAAMLMLCSIWSRVCVKRLWKDETLYLTQRPCSSCNVLRWRANTKRWLASKQASKHLRWLFQNTWGARIPWLCVPNYSGHLPRYPLTLRKFLSPLDETITLSTALDCRASPPRPSTVFHL